MKIIVKQCYSSTDSSAQFTISLNKSTIAPVGWLPLQAYPDAYFSVAMISLTGIFWGTPGKKW
jgi:hypothetical protein